MNKEYYKANEVVFGLRDEYVRIKKRLEILKKYTKLNSKYKDLNFTIIGDRIIYDFAYKHKNLFSLTHPNIIAEPIEKKEDGYYTGYTLQIINQDSFKIIEFNEIEKDGMTGLGKMKHWHIYNIMAKKI